MANDTALRVGLHRLEKEGRIRRLWRDAYAIVPMEYAAAGAPPVLWFLDDLMRSLDRPYYVGLHSACELLMSSGTEHRWTPAEVWERRTVQVVTDVPPPSVRTPEITCEFYSNPLAAGLPTNVVESGRRRVVISSPATTVLDLLDHSLVAGGSLTDWMAEKELAGLVTWDDLRRAAAVRLGHDRGLLLRLGNHLDDWQLPHLADPLWNFLFVEHASDRASVDVSKEGLTETLRRVPSEVFWKEGTSVPNYNAIFVWYVRRLLAANPQPIEALLAKIEQGKILNLSSFQRAVASERQARQDASAPSPNTGVKATYEHNRWGVLTVERTSSSPGDDGAA